MLQAKLLESCVQISNVAVHLGIYWLLQSMLLIAIGLLVAKTFRTKGAAVQSAIYRMTLAAALACPIVSLLLATAGMPSLKLHLAADAPAAYYPTGELKHEAMTADDEAALGGRQTSLADRISSSDMQTAARSTLARQPNASQGNPRHVPVLQTFPTINWSALLHTVLAAVWFLGSSVLAIRLYLGWRLAGQLCRSACPADSRTAAECRALAARMSVRAPQVLRSGFAASPALVGIFRPVVLLPEEEILQANDQEVLVHELAHLARGDQVWSLVGHIGTTLLFYQPLMWLLVRRMMLAAEEVCDDYVIHLGFDRPAYARRLVDVAERYQPAQAPAVGMVSLRFWISRRVVRILDSSRQLSLSAGRRAIGIAVVASLMATILVGLVGIGRKEAKAAPGESSSKPAGVSSTTTQEAKQLTVRGKVLAPEGQPVADATVRAGVDHWAMLDLIVGHDGKLPVSETKTDANGEFTITFTTQSYGDLSGFDQRWRNIWKRTNIAALAPGYGAAWVVYDDVQPDRPITLQLVRDVPIKGRVVDAAGKPVAGLEIAVANYALQAAKDENLTPWLDGIKQGQLPWVVVNLTPKEIEPALVGVPRRVTTDQQGRFEIHGVGRERHLDLTFQSETVARREITVVTRKMEMIERVILPPGYERPEPSKRPVYGAEFTVTTSPSRPIVGVVCDAKTGKPLAGVSVESDKLADYPFVEHRVLKTKTDADGRYRLVGMPKGKGNRLVVLPNDDQPYLMREVTLPDPEGLGPVTANIELHRGVWITGRVTEKETGKPVRARIYYLPFHSNQFAKATPEFGKNFNADGYQGRYESHADGTYRLVGLPGRAIVGAESTLRQYRVGVGADAIQGIGKEGHFDTYANPIMPGPKWPNVMKEINPPAETESVTVDLEMDSGKSVRVSVVDPDGKPISGVQVDGAVSSHGGRDTIEEPTFDVTNLASGETRRLVLHHEKRKFGLVTQVKAEQSGSEPVVIRLQPVGTLKGRLLLPDGTPVVGAGVEAILSPSGDFGQELRLGPTDARGCFEYALLPGVNYHLKIEGGNLRVDRVEQLDFVEGDLLVKPNEVKDLGDVTLGQREKAKEKAPAKAKP